MTNVGDCTYITSQPAFINKTKLILVQPRSTSLDAHGFLTTVFKTMTMLKSGVKSKDGNN